MAIDREHLLAAARLVDDLDGQRRREAVAYANGFRDGYATGHDVGHGQAHAELDRAWNALAARILATGKVATPAEHAAMDASAAAGEPCTSKCDACSRCTRAAAVARRGADYTGGPVSWDTDRATNKGQAAA